MPSADDVLDIAEGWVCRPGDDETWADPDLDETGWTPVEVGKPWTESGLADHDGVAWYRLRFRLPASLRHSPDFRTYNALKLRLGKIRDVDRTWFNGEVVGEIRSLRESFLGPWATVREYEVPAGLIRWDEDNVIAVRVSGPGSGMYEGPYGIEAACWRDFFGIAIDVGCGNGICVEDGFEVGARVHNGTPMAMEGTLRWQLADDEGAVVLETPTAVSLAARSTEEVGCKFAPDVPGFYRATCIFEPTSGDESAAGARLLGYRPEEIKAPLTRQPDFDAFWANTLAALAGVGPPFGMTREPGGDTETHELHQVRMRSLGNVRVRGWYEKPKGAGTFPALLWLPGSAQSMEPTQTSDPIAVLSFNIRAHGNSQEDVPGEPDDHWLRGLDDKEGCFYQGAYADCVRAVDFLTWRPEVDPDRIAVTGASQGGGLSLATAALDRRISLCAPDVPFLCNWEKCFRASHYPEMEQEMAQWIAAAPHRSWESVLRTLSYFDTMNMADRITCPVFLGLGLQDPVCPPATIFAVYNRLKVPKSYRVYPDAGHWVDAAHHVEKRAWLLRHLGVVSEG